MREPIIFSQMYPQKVANLLVPVYILNERYEEL